MFADVSTCCKNRATVIKSLSEDLSTSQLPSPSMGPIENFDFEEFPGFIPHVANEAPVPTAATPHQYELSEKGRKWMTLHVLSFAKSDKYQPVLPEGLSLECQLEFVLPKKTTVKKVIASVS